MDWTLIQHEFREFFRWILRAYDRISPMQKVEVSHICSSSRWEYTATSSVKHVDDMKKDLKNWFFKHFLKKEIQSGPKKDQGWWALKKAQTAAKKTRRRDLTLIYKQNVQCTNPSIRGWNKIKNQPEAFFSFTW